MNVTYCKNSTLREVHAAIVGLPDVMSPDEFSALRTRISREWPTHEFSSLRALLPSESPIGFDPNEVAPPTWFGQVAWDERRWVGRWGHRVVDLHRIVPEGESYQTFVQTMQPTLERWLLVAGEAYQFVGVDPPVATVAFGYLNAFTLEPDAGDLSEWFRFNFAVEAAGVEAGLSELAVAARIPRPEQAARASIHLSARRDDALTRVTVHTMVDKDVPQGISFSRPEGLLAEIQHAKDLAKETFFSFVTERALTHMGATDAVEREA